MKHFTLVILSLVFSANLFAKSEAELAKESIAKCKATANDKPTPELIISKVNKACELIAKDGEAAFPKFKGKDSEFLFCGTYVWVNDLQAKMLMHPIKYKMEGKVYFHLRDRHGKLIFIAFNKVAEEKGAGWVSYVWPKPGEKTVSKKISYVKLAEHGGKKYVVGCGVYDMEVKGEVN